MNPQLIDFWVVVIANLFNLLIVGIMRARVKGWSQVERSLGIVSVILSLPLTVAVAFYAINGYARWMVVLPGILIIFLMTELLLDYVLKIDFRKTRWLGPYLLLFYAAQWGMIGFSFGLSAVYGFVSLITYFLSLGATAYSYKNVGHGHKNPEV